MSADSAYRNVSRRTSGLGYPNTVGASIDVAATLWQADLDNVQSLLSAPANVAAWNEASLSWLVNTTEVSDPVTARVHRRHHA